ncbi:MAG: ATP-binding protein [Pseudomonadota bacterium]
MVRKSKSESASNWTILLADDDADYGLVTRMLLEREGHTVLLAENGFDTLTILRECHVDLLLLDYFMPGMTGEEVVTELRKFNQQVQVILQTGYASEQPPHELLKRLDIQGYHDKSEGPHKLLMWTDIGLKAAYTVQVLNRTHESLRNVLQATPELYRVQPFDVLLQSVMLQIAGLIGAKNSFLASAILASNKAAATLNADLSSNVTLMGKSSGLIVMAGTGIFAEKKELSAYFKPDTFRQLNDALEKNTISVLDNATVVPLLAEGELLGIVYLDRRVIQQSDLDLLQIFASQASVAIRNTRLHEMTMDQLIQSDKLASIGQLAAGVAHEINNPIGYIFSNFGTLEKYLGSLFEVLAAHEAAAEAFGDGPITAKLDEVRQRLEVDYLKEDIPVLMHESKEGISRVRKIVQDLKDFSHVDSTQEWSMADIHAGIDSTLNIVNNEVKYSADVIKNYGDLPEVQCFPSQINQVVMNIVVNAAHAMGSKRGEIRISTGCEGSNIWITIADNGSGITKENLSRIFDPFFTTKPVGKGTGLGLSLSYGIVQKHAGRLEVDSEVGKGTTFRITLPIVQTAAADA